MCIFSDLPFSKNSFSSRPVNAVSYAFMPFHPGVASFGRASSLHSVPVSIDTSYVRRNDHAIYAFSNFFAIGHNNIISTINW